MGNSAELTVAEFAAVLEGVTEELDADFFTVDTTIAVVGEAADVVVGATGDAG